MTILYIITQNYFRIVTAAEVCIKNILDNQGLLIRFFINSSKNPVIYQLRRLNNILNLSEEENQDELFLGNDD